MTKPQSALSYTEALYLMELREKQTAIIIVLDQSRTKIQFILPKSYSVADFRVLLGAVIVQKAVIKASGDIFEGALVRKDLPVYVFYLPIDFWPQYCLARRMLQLINEMARAPHYIHPHFKACQEKARSMPLVPELKTLITATGKTLGEYL